MQVVQRVETLYQSLKEKLHLALNGLGETVRLVLNEVCAQDSQKAFTVYWGPDEKGTSGVRGALRKLMLVCVRRNLDLAAHTRCDARAHAHNSALSMLLDLAAHTRCDARAHAHNSALSMLLEHIRLILCILL